MMIDIHWTHKHMKLNEVVNLNDKEDIEQSNQRLKIIHRHISALTYQKRYYEIRVDSIYDKILDMPCWTVGSKAKYITIRTVTGLMSYVPDTPENITLVQQHKKYVAKVHKLRNTIDDLTSEKIDIMVHIKNLRKVNENKHET